MDHLETVGSATKAPEGTCSRARHCTGVATPLLGCGHQGQGGLAAQQGVLGAQISEESSKTQQWCNSGSEHPECDSALVSTKKSQKQEKRCNFTRWVFPTAGSDLIMKIFENDHCNSWDNTGLSPSKLAFSSAAMSHVDRKAVFVAQDCILLFQITSQGSCISIRIYQVAKPFPQTLLVTRISSGELL